jgi:hypothetical protein
MRDTRTVSDRAEENEAERRGGERADAAHERGENARERSQLAHAEATKAADADSAKVHRAEAALHDEAVLLQDAAEKLQRHHIEEARRSAGKPGEGGEDSR